MGTGSEHDEGRGGFEESSSEPLGLSATAFGRPATPRPRTPIAPAHQQAVELISTARRHLREGNTEEAERLCHQAARLELQVLDAVTSQPERSLIAELGARAALQSGGFDLARKLVWKGLFQASEPMQWSLLRVSIETDLLEIIGQFERGWRIPWESVDDEESRILMVSRSGRRIVFHIDPDAAFAAKKHSSSTELGFVIPASRPDGAVRDILDGVLTSWLRPKCRAQAVSERRDVFERYMLVLVPA